MIVKLCSRVTLRTVKLRAGSVGLSIDIFSVIDGDDVDDQLMMLDAIDDAVAAGAVLAIAGPLTFEEFAQLRMDCQAIDGPADLLTQLGSSRRKDSNFSLANFARTTV